MALIKATENVWINPDNIAHVEQKGSRYSIVYNAGSTFTFVINRQDATKEFLELIDPPTTKRNTGVKTKDN
jgi:hypothetical protein